MTDKKYLVALKFVNKLLDNMGKENIDKLEDFKDIDRDNISTGQNKDTLVEMEDEIFKVFDKRACGYYNRKTSRSYPMSVLRGMANELGLKFVYEKKNSTVEVDGKNYKRTKLIYHFEE